MVTVITGKYLFDIRMNVQWMESGRRGEFVDVVMCLIFFLTDMLVVHSECCVWTCRLTSIQCNWSLSHALKVVSRLCLCVLMWFTCVCWSVNVCCVCVILCCVLIHTQSSHWHMMYAHISVGKQRYNQFLRYFILTHSLLPAAVPLRYQCGWETSIVPSRFTMCGWYGSKAYFNTNRVMCVSMSVTAWLCYLCHWHLLYLVFIPTRYWCAYCVRPMHRLPCRHKILVTQQDTVTHNANDTCFVWK